LRISFVIKTEQKNSYSQDTMTLQIRLDTFSEHCFLIWPYFYWSSLDKPTFKSFHLFNYSKYQIFRNYFN